MDGPWSEGPKELLQHAVGHLALDGDFDRRIAMISIDNAVELMIKTYLGLPRRRSGAKGPSRKQLEEASNSFPSLLDLLDEFAGDKLTGVSLDELEWYHRIRNQLYHAGNGITVEAARVQTYLSLSKTLFQNLFEVDLVLASESPIQSKLGLFLGRWGVFEKELGEMARQLALPDQRPEAVLFYKADKDTKILWKRTKEFRNVAVHKLESLSPKDFEEPIKSIDELRARVRTYA